MNSIPTCTALVGVLLCVGCAGSKQKLDDVQSMEYLQAHEGKKLVYPEGVDAPERSSEYEIPPLSPEATARDYDVNELARPPALIEHKLTGDEEKVENKKTALLREQQPKLYAGIGYGRLDFHDRYNGISYSDNPAARQIYAGFRFNDYTAVELAYKQPEDINLDEIPGSGFDRLNISSEFNALIARAKVSLPLWRLFDRLGNFTVFGTVGYFDSSMQRKVTELNALETDSASGGDSGLAFGGGVSYQLGKVNLRGYFESFDVEDIGKANDTGIAIEFGF